MTKFLLIVVLVLTLVSVIAVFMANRQGKKQKATEQKYNELCEVYIKVIEKAERLQKAVSENKTVEEAANAEKSELSKTPDSGLADRANNLFNK